MAFLILSKIVSEFLLMFSNGLKNEIFCLNFENLFFLTVFKGNFLSGVSVEKYRVFHKGLLTLKSHNSERQKDEASGMIVG